MNAQIEIGWEKPRRKGVSALAVKVGFSKTYISLVLSGKQKPGKPLSKKLLKLGIDLSEMNGEKNPPFIFTTIKRRSKVF